MDAHHHHCHAEGEAPDAGKLDTIPASFSGTVYTCPMHPQVRHAGPGACPICGMALEPLGVPVDAPTEELIDFTRRLSIDAP
ncbi:MAG: copper-transporting ATPase, partial [Amphiplicatus sp.]|nr:copper-transporting ATPase [Amphiplicatus sp.]